MPIYEYQCQSCGSKFEGYASMQDSSLPGVCACGGAGERRIFHSPRVFGDYPGYVSPASGKWVEGRRAREEDFKRTGCREYESGERQAYEVRKAAEEREFDNQVDEYVERTFNELTT